MRNRRPRSSFSPSTHLLEHRCLLTGATSLAGAAAAVIQPLAKPAPPPPLSGSATGQVQLSFEEPSATSINAAFTGGSLQKFGAVKHGDGGFIGKGTTITDTEFRLYTTKGYPKNHLIVNSTQAYTFSLTKTSQAVLKFKIENAAGAFASLNNKTVTGTVTFNTTTRTLTVKFG